MQKVHSARSACRKMTNERREEGKGIYLRWWSWMAELTMVLVTVLGGGDGETQWQQRGFRCVEIPIGVLFPRRFYPFYPFSSFSPTVSLSLRVDIPGFFWFLLSRSVSLSLGWFLSPFAAVFFLFFFSCVRVVFIGAGGAGSTLPRPIAAHAWGARLLHRCGAGWGGQWWRRLQGTTSLLSHHEEVQVASGFGCIEHVGRKSQGEEN
jgi:hypothetical protein